MEQEKDKIIEELIQIMINRIKDMHNNQSKTLIGDYEGDEFWNNYDFGFYNKDSITNIAVRRSKQEERERIIGIMVNYKQPNKIGRNKIIDYLIEQINSELKEP